MQSAVCADLLYPFFADVSICRERFTWSAALVRLLTWWYGGYTIRKLRVLSASVAASASYTIRTLRVLSASAAASYTVRTFASSGQRCSAALLRNTQTNTRHRCLFFISIDEEYSNTRIFDRRKSEYSNSGSQCQLSPLVSSHFS